MQAVTKFQTADGVLFDTSEAALRHEAGLVAAEDFIKTYSQGDQIMCSRGYLVDGEDLLGWAKDNPDALRLLCAAAEVNS